MNSADFVVDKRPNLAAIDGFPKVDFADYERRLGDMQQTLQRIQQAYLGTPHRAVIALEGWDTAGKGGVVRRLGWALDPRSFRVARDFGPGRARKVAALPPAFLGASAAARPDRRLRPLLVRARAGRAGRGLRRARRMAARLRGDQRVRAMLLDDGVRLVKLFLHITPEEQLRRFRNRLDRSAEALETLLRGFPQPRPLEDYEKAIEDMMEKTSPSRAPWHLIPAKDKPYGRLAALRIIADRLSKDVSLEPRPLDPKSSRRPKACSASVSRSPRRARESRPKHRRARDRLSLRPSPGGLTA